MTSDPTEIQGLGESNLFEVIVQKTIMMYFLDFELKNMDFVITVIEYHA